MESLHSDRTKIRFGVFCCIPTPGGSAAVGSRQRSSPAFDFLLFLVVHHRQVVTRGGLLAEAWPEVRVNP